MISSEPYLIRLAHRLAAGIGDMPPDRIAQHREFIRLQQTPDGGYRGREGDSDMYYTSFAVRGLVMLGGMDESECASVGRFVQAHMQSQLSVVDLVSWLSTGLAVQISGGEDPFAEATADWTQRLADSLEAVRTDDGGYAKTTEGAAGSTYQSFLVALIYELIGREVPEPNRLIQFLYDRQRDDGGFVEIQPMKRSGTNPTAAAVALLNMLGGMDDELRQDVREFLLEVRCADGGFQANTRIPFPDGLSTFTAILTAQDLGLDDLYDPELTRRFITDPQFGLELPTGGFRGASWDNQADVEYTFYGLGTLALLNRD